MKSSYPTCPRCLGSIPNNDTPGKFPGAMSRYAEDTEICSACGTDEAMRGYFGSPDHIHAALPENWPLSNAHEFRPEMMGGSTQRFPKKNTTER